MDVPATVFVAGSAHLDVMAQVTGDDVAIDKIGEVTIEIGGTACNIATNLAVLGLKPRLMTVMRPRSPYTQIITTHLNAHNVEVRAFHREDISTAVFSAHIGKDGEMLSAVSSMPLDTTHFPDEQVQDAMNGSKCVVLECNLSVESLRQFSRIAKDMGIPVVVAAVSEEKSLRLAGLGGIFDLVFMNRREASYFGRRVLAATAPTLIAERLGCNLVVSRGSDGAVVIDHGQEIEIPLGLLPVAGQTLGAGDALLSATVLNHVINGLSLADSVRESFAFASGIIGRANCNAGSNQAVEAAINVLDNQARRDPLTGLTNRRAGEHALEMAFRSAVAGGAFSVLMVDIDKFKFVNDTYGHDVGDEVIKAVAAILSATVRGNDTPCRWGGEEFLCILTGLDEATTMKVAERIRAGIEAAAVPIAGSITVSIGAAVYTANSSLKELLHQADLALYRAKSNGRNRVESRRES